jgi:unsaturated chondroitin disaccharide hydrolase
VYRHTRELQFLETARRCADWFLSHLPANRVPYWDFDLPEGSDRLHDSSAAAIAASGLLQLAELARESKDYQTAAYEILNELCQDDFLAVSRPGWEGILCHGVYHVHKKLGVDESVMWGDHFFVEALVKAINGIKS